MKLLVNDLLLYFGLMSLLPLTLAGHKLHLTQLLPPSGFPDPHRGLSNNDVISSGQDKYYAVFLLLVYRLAPRTFRLRI